MAKKIDIQLNLKTNGAGQIQGLTLDLEDFQRAVQSAAKGSTNHRRNHRHRRQKSRHRNQFRHHLLRNSNPNYHLYQL